MQVTESPSTARFDEPCSSSAGLLGHCSRQLGPGDWDEVILRASCQLCLQLPLGTRHSWEGSGADGSGRGDSGAEHGRGVAGTKGGGGCVWVFGAGRTVGVTCRQILEEVHAFYQVRALNIKCLGR